MNTPLAVISDIHSNFEALTAVLEDVRSQGVENIVCLGDTVGYASGVRSCVRTVRALGCPVLLGNHDEAACQSRPPEDFNDTAAAGIIFAAARLTEANRSWLSSLPKTLEISGLTFTHASLEKDYEWAYILGADDARMHFEEQRTPIAFCGHTHYPMVWIEESPMGRIRQRLGEGIVSLPPSGKVLVNVGAVGQPRDGDPRSCYVIYRPETNTVEFRRVSYDLQQTRKKILRAKLPRFTANRLLKGQ